MDLNSILAILNFAAPIIVIGITRILKKWISTRWAPLIVFILGGISTLIGVGPAPGSEWIDKVINVAFISGGATLIYDFFKKIKGPAVLNKTGRSSIACMLLLICAIVIALGMSGCAYIQSAAKDAGQIDLKNAEATRQLARDMLSTWKLNSGAIRGALGPKLGELPAQAVEAMKELDALAEKTELTDYDLGYSLGARVRMLSSIVQETFKLFAPEILKYIPSVLAL